MKRIGLLLVLLCFAVGFGQTYVFQRQFDIRTLDPAGFFDNLSQSVIENLYEGLYGYKGATAELEPRLATSYVVSDEGRTHTFKLREGVKFHSGNPFSCADVEYSIKRALILSTGTLSEAILGAGNAYVADLLDEDPSEADYARIWQLIDDGVECEDDLTAVIRIAEPDAILLARASTPRYHVVDRAWAIAGGEWDGTEATWRDWIDADTTAGHLHDKASGTGAYRLAGWTPGTQLTAARFSDYWGMVPQIQTVIYEIEESEVQRAQALLTGKADQIDFAPSYWTDLAGKPGVRILDPATDTGLPWGLTSIWAIVFNHQIEAAANAHIGSGELDGLGIPPDFFADPDVRRCFAYSFDPDAYNQAEWDGTAVTLAMAMLPQYEAYDPQVPQFGLDLARAEAHCRAAWDGELWEKGMWFTILYVPEYTPAVEVARQFQHNLRTLNSKFIVDLREGSWDEYFGDSDGMRLPFDVIGSVSSLPDPLDYVENWYKSANSWPGYFGYFNEEIDRLADEARAEFDAAKRTAHYRRIGWLGYEDTAFILLPNAPYVMVTSDKVGGVYRNPAHAEVRWQDLTKTH